MDFDLYFKSIFGARWTDALKPALLAPPPKVHISLKDGRLDMSEAAVTHGYALDRASLEPVFALDLQPGMRFLDVCSAPGGKALAALFSVGCNAQARLNDISRDRVARLKAVLYDYLPAEVVERFLVTCSDGSRIGMREPGVYDRVLVDAPCSAERHHLLDGGKLGWTHGSSKRLAIRQHALLCSALDATCAGGRVVYSTCSISPLENDGVVAKLMKSREGQFEIVRPNPGAMGEPTEHGVMILPDRCDGFGPIYYSVLEKVSGTG